MLSTFGLIFDVLILAALVVTIRQAFRLNRDFAAMQADRKAFENLIAALNIAAARAESAIKTLKDTAVESGDLLQDKINTARTLTQELDIMIQAGDSLANRLSGAAEQSRRTHGTASKAPASAPSPSPAAAPLSRAEKELLEALQARQNQG
jgi:prophage DNA circulation protein